MAAVTKGGKASAQLPTGEVRNFIQDGGSNFGVRDHWWRPPPVS